MKFQITLLAGCAALTALSAAPAVAQRQPPPTPEQRLDRLERQVQQVQRQVFPKGRPADTAGFSTEPAATQSSVVTLDQRLDALERQVADMLRQSEENGHRLQTIDPEFGRFRADQDPRLSTLEQRVLGLVHRAEPALTQLAKQPVLTGHATTAIARAPGRT